MGRNYHFTTQLRYFFQYKGGETLTFQGDDDVWVFVNGHHAVDIGGVHGAQNGRVILGDDGDALDNSYVPGQDSNCSIHRNGGSLTDGCTLSAGELQADPPLPAAALPGGIEDDKRFGLEKGHVYEIVLFQAERHFVDSNFNLTLAGFLSPRSHCQTDCGDEIVAGFEQCDLGDKSVANPDGNEDGIYNHCNTSCTYDFCGDGEKNGPEACDNAVNSDVWTSATPDLDDQCAPGCVSPGFCGDDVLQASSEVCDDGVNDGSYGECASGCQSFDGYCGDGQVNGDEDCDAATKVDYQAAPGGCGYDCKAAPYCGDGIRNGDEHCDGGIGCGANCQIVGYCGDGLLASAAGPDHEDCDYGPSNASPPPYAGCTTTCTLGPHCGDDIQDAPEEECDDGDASHAADGNQNDDTTYNGCTESCVAGPRCGDGIPQSIYGEVCDNGFNEDAYAYPGVSDACGPGCSAVHYCGDNIVDSDFEFCDFGDAAHASDGNQNDDTAYNGCTTNCEWGPFCGDGNPDPAEACDDGQDNAGYGQGKCNYDCTFAPYCGDGSRNGSGANAEQCDLGSVANVGGYGGCNPNCTRAPFCGDGNTDSNDGEACDDGSSGSLTCTPQCKRRSDITK